MKKTLLALALFGAVAGTASAASVTLYGTVDVGFGMTSVAGDHNARYEAADMNDTTFTLDSGNNSASKFGLKGVEELGNGMVVGFQLENGFSAASSVANPVSSSRRTSVRSPSAVWARS